MGRLVSCLGACAIALTGVGASFPAAAQGWQQLCKQGDSCKVQGTRPVRYGVHDKFHYGVATRTVQCNNETFGDPAPKLPKRCYAYYTAEEQAVSKASRNKDERIKGLEEEVQAMQVELDAANAELDALYRELRRERRRDERRGSRRRIIREQFGPFIIER